MPTLGRRTLICALAGLLGASLLTTSAAAQKPDPIPAPEPGPEADLSLQFEGASGIPLVGETYEFELQVANHGPETAADVFVYGYMSDSFEASDLPSECNADEYGGFSCLIGELGESDEIDMSFEMERVRAREAWASFSVSSSNYDPTYENNYTDLYVEPDISNPADIGVSMDAPRDPEVDEEFTYEIEVANNGPDEAHRVELTDSLPPGVDFIGWSSSDPTDECALTEEQPYGVSPEDSRPDYVYRELSCSLGSLDNGEVTEVEIDVVRNDPYEIWNSAWVTTASYDAAYDNDYAAVSSAPDASVTSDLSVGVSGPATAPLVGERFEMTFTVGNEGPAPTRDASLYGFLPDGLSFDSATSTDDGVACSGNDSGGGTGTTEGGSADPEPAPADEPSGGGRSIPYYEGDGFNCTLGSLGAGDAVDVVVVVTRTKARELWATASAWSSNFDPVYDNNYAEHRIEADTSNPADVGVAMSGPDDAEVGEDVEFTIEVSNEGPMEAKSVLLRDTLPYGLDFVSAESSDDSDSCSFVEDTPYLERSGDAPRYWGYREVACELDTMGIGESTTVTLTATRTTEYEVWNTAYVESSTYDANAENDYASAMLEGERIEVCPLEPTGSPRADEIADYDCPVKAGAGADSIVVQTDSESKDVDVFAGKGRDWVTVNVASGSERSRRIEVNTGPGADRITIVVAPGATSAVIVVRAGKGNDHVTIDAPRLSQGLRIIVFGQAGNDQIGPTQNTAASDATWSDGFRLRGGTGADSLTGAYANDFLFGGGGRDLLDGAAGADRLDGGPGRDECRGGPGEDSLTSC